MSTHDYDESETYAFAGYLRFVESDEPGVIAHVISKYAPGHAVDSDVPIYRIYREGGGTVTKGELERKLNGGFET